jgi:hypothetical protein
MTGYKGTKPLESWIHRVAKPYRYRKATQS